MLSYIQYNNYYTSIYAVYTRTLFVCAHSYVQLSYTIQVHSKTNLYILSVLLPSHYSWCGGDPPGGGGPPSFTGWGSGGSGGGGEEKEEDDGDCSVTL